MVLRSVGTFATFALLASLLAACGGGGGGPPAPLLEARELGLVRADVASTLTVTIANPLGEEAVVEEVEPPTGSFAFAPTALPAVVEGEGDLRLQLSVTPPGPGELFDEFRIRFRAPGVGEQDVIVSVSARVEESSIVLVTRAIDFGSVRIGESAARDVSVRNPNVLTPIRLTGISPLHAAFTTTGVVLPQTIGPGETGTFVVTYEPASLDNHEFRIALDHSEGSALLVDVTALTDTWIPEMITDFGEVPVVAAETEWLEVDVPPHGVSLSLEAIGPETALLGLLGLEGPGGRVYENEDATGLYLWSPGEHGVLSQAIPNSDQAAVQLVDGGGTYRFRFYLLSGSAATLGVRAIVHNRPNTINDAGVLDLNVHLAPALGITDPVNETRLQQVLERIDEIFSQQGLRLGAIGYFQLDDDRFDRVTVDEFGDLLQESAAAPETRLNLFFVERTLSGGVLGVAARVPGPARNGTQSSGVMVDYDFGSASTAGHVTAHELGHYLGLFHTTESDGSHDLIEDTLECAANGADDTCATDGGDYLMHWRVLDTPNPIITDGQGLVILGHALVQPPSILAAVAQRRALPAPGALDALPDGWCGTPGCRK